MIWTVPDWILQLVSVAHLILLGSVPGMIGTLDFVAPMHNETDLAIASFDDVESLGDLACYKNLLPELELLADQLVDDAEL